MRKDVADILKLEIKDEEVDVVLAVGKTITCGIANVDVKDVKGRETVNINFIVSSKLNQNIILGVNSIKSLGVIPDHIQDRVFHINRSLQR